jgi:hypothetical protein
MFRMSLLLPSSGWQVYVTILPEATQCSTDVTTNSVQKVTVLICFFHLFQSSRQHNLLVTMVNT